MTSAWRANGHEILTVAQMGEADRLALCVVACAGFTERGFTDRRGVNQ